MNAINKQYEDELKELNRRETEFRGEELRIMQEYNQMINEIKKLKQKGKIVYEYNPFKNLRIIPQATHYKTQNGTYEIAANNK